MNPIFILQVIIVLLSWFGFFGTVISEEIRILTYNVNWQAMANEGSRTIIKNVIEENGPYDIIALQECSNYIDIIQISSMLQSMSSFITKDGLENACLFWKASKFTPINKTNGSIAEVGRPFQTIQFNFSGRILCFVNNHWPHPPRDGTDIIVSAIESTCPSYDGLIIVGDFNRNTNYLATLQSTLNIQDSVSLMNMAPMKSCCYPHYYMAFDHQFYNRGFSIIDTHMIDGGASDHNPVVSTVNFFSQCDVSQMSIDPNFGSTIMECASDVNVCEVHKNIGLNTDYGDGTCNDFCLAFGMDCAGQWKADGICMYGTQYSTCYDQGSSVNEHICRCSVPMPTPPPTPLSQCSASHMDSDQHFGTNIIQCEATEHVCEVYQKLANDDFYGDGTCAGFCSTFGLDCEGQWEDSNGCGRSTQYDSCNERGGGTSDHICRCIKTTQTSPTTPPTKLPTFAPLPTQSPPASRCSISQMDADQNFGNAILQCEATSSVCEVYQKLANDNAYGDGTCAGFCSSFGLDCEGQWEDTNGCVRSTQYASCYERGGSTSDHICRCIAASPTAPSPPSPWPTPSPIASPAVSQCTTSQIRADSNFGINIHECMSNSTVCEVYQQLANDDLYGDGTCAGFCSKFGLICAGQWDDNNSCERGPQYLSCHDRGGSTSDHICQCTVSETVVSENVRTDGNMTKVIVIDIVLAIIAIVCILAIFAVVNILNHRCKQKKPIPRNSSYVSMDHIEDQHCNLKMISV